MEIQTIECEAREGRGKGDARKLRASGKIPAVFYGPTLDAQAIALSPKQLSKALQTPFRRNVLLKLVKEGQEYSAMLKELSQHPVTKTILHADFYQVSAEKPVRVRVPVRTLGRAAGVQKGGKLRVMFRDLPVLAAPSNIPATIDIDVADLDLHQSYSVADLKLPEGVVVQLPETQKTVMIGGESRKAVAGDDAEKAEGEAEGGAAS